MTSNTFLLYGPDTYRSRQKLNAIKKKYIDASLGDTNLATIDGATATLDEITRQLYALPFLAKSRLVVVENLLTQGKSALREKVTQALDKIPESTVCVFYEQGEPDKRGKLFRTLVQPKQSQHFDKLPPNDLANWIKQFAAQNGATIAPDAVALLANWVGADLWRLANELAKLALYTKTITTEIIKLLIEPPIGANIFDLTDAIGEHHKTKAFGALKKLLDAGENGVYILTMLHYGVRNLALVKANAPVKMHPFVLQKTRAAAGNITKDAIARLYDQLARFDAQVKTGIMESETAAALYIAQAIK